MARLGDYFSQSTARGRQGLPLVSVTIEHGLVERASLERRMETTLKPEEHLLVPAGALAYNMMRMWQGAVGVADTDCLVSPSYVVAVPRETIDPEFARYLFKSDRFLYFLRAYSYGVTDDRWRLYYQDFAAIPFSAPPLDNQRRITAILRTWDEAIDAASRLVAAKTRQRSHLMRVFFDLCHPGGADRPAGWREFKLGDVFQERDESDCADELLLSVTMERGIVPREEVGRKDSSAADKSAYKLICPGDIGYNTMRMWQGVSALSTLRGIVSPAYTVVIPDNQNILDRYAAHLFKSPRMVFDFERYSQGLTSDTWNLKFPAFAEIEVRLPPMELQRQHAELLDQATAEITALGRFRDALQRQKRGLMQKLLTGEWRTDSFTEEAA